MPSQEIRRMHLASAEGGRKQHNRRLDTPVTAIIKCDRPETAYIGGFLRGASTNAKFSWAKMRSMRRCWAGVWRY